jgi:hypothetical protein
MKRTVTMVLVMSIALFADFTRDGSVVTDSTTGLQWQDDAIGSTMNWKSAIEQCENLTLDGHSDWRLPNLKELTSIVDDTRVNPSIDTDTFQFIASSFYWSSTTNAGNSSDAWNVYFNYGYQYSYYKSDSYFVRCVRAGQL